MGAEASVAGRSKRADALPRPRHSGWGLSLRKGRRCGGEAAPAKKVEETVHHLVVARPLRWTKVRPPPDLCQISEISVGFDRQRAVVVATLPPWKAKAQASAEEGGGGGAWRAGMEECSKGSAASLRERRGRRSACRGGEFGWEGGEGRRRSRSNVRRGGQQRGGPAGGGGDSGRCDCAERASRADWAQTGAEPDSRVPGRTSEGRSRARPRGRWISPHSRDLGVYVFALASRIEPRRLPRMEGGGWEAPGPAAQRAGRAVGGHSDRCARGADLAQAAATAPPRAAQGSGRGRGHIER